MGIVVPDCHSVPVPGGVRGFERHLFREAWKPAVHARRVCQRVCYPARLKGPAMPDSDVTPAACISAMTILIG